MLRPSPQPSRYWRLCRLEPGNAGPAAGAVRMHGAIAPCTHDRGASPPAGAAAASSRAARLTSRGLTATERAILRLLRGGARLDAVALGIGCSVATVRTHLRNIRAKLAIRTTHELRRRLADGEYDDLLAGA